MSGGAELFTGWGPDAPASDTVLRAFLLNWADSTAVAVEATGGQVRRRDDLVAADVGRPAGFTNCAILLAPLGTASTADVLGALDDLYGFASGGKTGEVVLISAWPTPDLRPRGWALMGHPPIHLVPPGRGLPPAPPGLRIEPVTDEVGLRVWEDVVVAGYPLPDVAPYLPGGIYPSRVLTDGRFRFWLGWHDGRPVGVAAAFVSHGVNNVLIVATLPEARGRGFGQALTWRAALAEPGLPAVLLSSDDGRPVYDRMGFFPLFRFTLWHRLR